MVNVHMLSSSDMIEYNHLSVLGRLYVGTRRVVSTTGCLCVCGMGSVRTCMCGACVREGVCVCGGGGVRACMCVWRYYV